ncbi:MAG: hypothetical protein ACRYG2_03045, partial [Janthinobacterium lividum]
MLLLDLGRLTPWAYAAAALAGLGVLALLPPPRDLRSLVAERRLRPARGHRWFRSRDDAVPLRRRVLVGVALGAVAALLTGRAGLGLGWAGPLAAVVALAVAVLLGRVEPAAARRRRQVLVLQTPQALELMASCLAAGLPVRGACG